MIAAISTPYSRRASRGREDNRSMIISIQISEYIFDAYSIYIQIWDPGLWSQICEKIRLTLRHVNLSGSTRLDGEKRGRSHTLQVHRRFIVTRKLFTSLSIYNYISPGPWFEWWRQSRVMQCNDAMTSHAVTSQTRWRWKPKPNQNMPYT